jgi:hypothetical protein
MLVSYALIKERGMNKMVKKTKFKPVITRIKLNPEQAVLTCACYSVGRLFSASEANKGSAAGEIFYCYPGNRTGSEIPCTGSLKGNVTGRTTSNTSAPSS